MVGISIMSSYADETARLSNQSSMFIINVALAHDRKPVAETC